jgi:hypothetical protein
VGAGITISSGARGCVNPVVIRGNPLDLRFSVSSGAVFLEKAQCL